jgi:putative SOS response-associated peptidase YedK
VCIRFDQERGELVRWSKFLKTWVPLADWTQGLDLYPGYDGHILRSEGVKLAWMTAKWGLVPPWAPEANYARKWSTYNARSETITELRTFREPIRKRRCIIPATAFYERQSGASGKLERWIRFRAAAGAMAIAGIFEEANTASGGMATFSMVTTDPNTAIGEIHDRMPVILTLREAATWLDPKSELQAIRRLLAPAADSSTITEDAGPIESQRKSPNTQGSLFD